MLILTQEFIVNSKGRDDCLDVTDSVQEVIDQAGLTEGNVVIFVPGSTAAITTIEYESGVIEDLRRALEQFFPSDSDYQHHHTAGDNNGASHLRAAMIGPSLAVPVVDGRLQLGMWQQIVLIDCDMRPRQRRYLIQLIGNTQS